MQLEGNGWGPRRCVVLYANGFAAAKSQERGIDGGIVAFAGLVVSDQCDLFCR